MSILRILLIFVLGISVVAAIPVSPMTSSIQRRDPGFKEKIFGVKPKPILTKEEAKQRWNGLWTAVIHITVPSTRSDSVGYYSHDPNPQTVISYDVYMKISNGVLEVVWPRGGYSLKTLLFTPPMYGWSRVPKYDRKRVMGAMNTAQAHSGLPLTGNDVADTQDEYRKDVIEILQGSKQCTKYELTVKVGVEHGWRGREYYGEELCLPTKLLEH